jgi:hypothetical protein
MKTLLLASLLACAACGSPFTPGGESKAYVPPPTEVHCLESFPAVAGHWVLNGSGQYTFAAGKPAHDVCHVWEGVNCPAHQTSVTACPKTGKVGKAAP